jgi:hypothetical protein
MNARFKTWLKRHLPSAAISVGRTVARWARVFRYLALLSQFGRFRRLSRQSSRVMPARLKDAMFFPNDATTFTEFDRHYIYHPAWAARVLAKTRPPYHVDISSTLSFCTIVSAFLDVRFYDYRPARLELSNLASGHADLVSLPFKDNELPSLSCMHTVEHIGLGRYGDPLDPEGDLRAMRELSRVVAVDGSLLFVVPIGKPMVRFNGHRIYSFAQIVHSFPGMSLEDFSLVQDPGYERDFVSGANESLADRQHYGCGCFWFRKLLPR